jgi:hypothetical protein
MPYNPSRCLFCKQGFKIVWHCFFITVPTAQQLGTTGLLNNCILKLQSYVIEGACSHLRQPFCEGFLIEKRWPLHGRHDRKCFSVLFPETF